MLQQTSIIGRHNDSGSQSKWVPGWETSYLEVGERKDEIMG